MSESNPPAAVPQLGLAAVGPAIGGEKKPRKSTVIANTAAPKTSAVVINQDGDEDATPLEREWHVAILAKETVKLKKHTKSFTVRVGRV